MVVSCDSNCCHSACPSCRVPVNWSYGAVSSFDGMTAEEVFGPVDDGPAITEDDTALRELPPDGQPVEVQLPTWDFQNHLLAPAPINVKYEKNRLSDGAEALVVTFRSNTTTFSIILKRDDAMRLGAELKMHAGRLSPFVVAPAGAAPSAPSLDIARNGQRR